MNKKRMKKYLVIGLVILECLTLNLTMKSYSNRELSNLVEENKVDKKKFSMYIENDTGNYEEYTTSEIFPSNLKYIINTDKSECTDIKGNIIENILTVNDNNLITISTNKTVYCYLYFDLETTKPVITTLYIGGSSNPTYTTTTSTTIYLTHADQDVESYCITEESTSDNCEWINSSEKEITTSYTLSSTDGVKTVNAYIKDLAGNISEVKSDTITLDSTYPTVTASASGNNTASPKITINSNETGTYCVNTSSTRTNMSNCTFSGSVTANTSLPTSAFSADGDYYVHVKDAAGNIGISSKVTITIAKLIGEYLLNNPSSGLNTTLQAGLYRYQGTSVNNYICFGTSDKNTCTGTPDKYMYRIIGINSSNQIKLIKNTSIGSMSWKNSETTSYVWTSSNPYLNINGDSFLNNTTYLSTTWKNKIISKTWTYGTVKKGNITASEWYNNETSFSKTITSKISLIYVHDYIFATNNGNGCSYAYYLVQCSNWFVEDNITTRTMTASESDSEGYVQQWVVHNQNVGAISEYQDTSTAIRPTFFIDNSLQYVSGTGKSSDPFIIS